MNWYFTLIGAAIILFGLYLTVNGFDKPDNNNSRKIFDNMLVVGFLTGIGVGILWIGVYQLIIV